MKILALLAVTFVSKVLANSFYESAWKDFKRTYRRKYANSTEESYRKNMFISNFIKIISHGDKDGFTMGVNHFADSSPKELSLSAGLKVGFIEGGLQAPQIIVQDLPEYFDWRKKGAVTDVKDQGYCGSCYAFSTVGAVESALQIANGSLIPFSKQQIVDCSRPYGNHGCGGGLIHTVFNYIIDQGLQTSNDYPYTGKGNETCKLDPSKVVTKLKNYVNVKQSEDALQQAVFRQPVSVAVSASRWSFYSKGVFNYSGSTTNPNHAVLVVGWGQTDDGVPYWIVKNSWGEDWGEKGYIRIIRGYDRCSISQYAVYPLMYQ